MKIELTAEQRLNYYERAKDDFRTVPEGPYICLVLKWALVSDGLITDTRISPEKLCKETFPEFAKVLADRLSQLNLWLLPDSVFGNEIREELLGMAIYMVNMNA